MECCNHRSIQVVAGPHNLEKEMTGGVLRSLAKSIDQIRREAERETEWASPTTVYPDITMGRDPCAGVSVPLQ